MIKINLFNFYIFLEKINSSIEKNILSLKKKIIIINFTLNNKNFQQFYSIIKFVKKNRINFFVKDDYKVAIRYKADGLFLSSNYKSLKTNFFVKKSFKIMGAAHNQFEYYIKKKQSCDLITLSPVFYNKKYSINKVLSPIKFNLLTLHWNCNLCALGGVSKNNINKILSTKTRNVGVKSFIE